ncbi:MULTISPECIES: hypothetical protein [unclassified Sphingobium]|uniref:hypothetical protein n=1 Tax=unclassified Sphingobium TaxID=2611147 RepID=UPI0035A5F17B
MARSEGNRVVPTTLFECVLWNYGVHLLCRCHHHAIFHPCGLWWHFDKRGWSDDFRDITARFYCRKCHAKSGQRIRPSLVQPSQTMPTILLPMPDEREWKRAIARKRG